MKLKRTTRKKKGDKRVSVERNKTEKSICIQPVYNTSISRKGVKRAQKKGKKRKEVMEWPAPEYRKEVNQIRHPLPDEERFTPIPEVAVLIYMV